MTQAPLEIEFGVPERYNASCILFDNLSAARAEKIALYCDQQTVTYRQLCDLSSQAGNALIAAGMSRSQRVLLLMHDTPEYVAAIFGAMRAGGVPVLINSLAPADLVAYYLQDSGAEVAIVHSDLVPLLSHSDVRTTSLRHVVCVGGVSSDHYDGLYKVHAWREWLDDQSAELAAADT